MPTESSKSRLKEIDATLGLHEIIASVRQLSFMREHCTSLLRTFPRCLDNTYAAAPVGRSGRGQTYELQRTERPDAQVLERLLEKRIWKNWSFASVAKHNTPFLPGVCDFIQSYQVPLQGSRKDRKWGKIDLLGATPNRLPVVVELKQGRASDTPLRMMVEAVAYACALRRAWNEGDFRAEWQTALNAYGLDSDVPQTLDQLPIVLLAPTQFWDTKIGVIGKRTSGKVRADAWPPFLDLVRQCAKRGMPIHFVQLAVTELEPTISDVSVVRLPGANA